jgi:predicted nucleic acid-binding protein
VITESELWAGIRSHEDEIRVAELLSRFNVIPITRGIARQAGSLLRTVSNKKTHFGDALIAATAIIIAEPVLTADRRSQRVFGDSVSYQVYR